MYKQLSVSCVWMIWIRGFLDCEHTVTDSVGTISQTIHSVLITKTHFSRRSTHFLHVLHFCRTQRRLPKGGRESLLSEFQETAMYSVMKFGRRCRGCWIYLFIYFLLCCNSQFTVLCCIPSSYSILLYFTFSSPVFFIYCKITLH